ncbi:MAG: hypothetical protein EXR99_03030 [Gemmataceae bacterium]|nr:hypothetical protein [Gemmataceae bacterium]
MEGNYLCIPGKFQGALFALLAFFLPSFAGETETRKFRVSVDGKPAGEMNLIIDKNEDASLTATMETDLKISSFLFFNYRYSYRGKETWKDGAILRLESVSNDNGARYSVLATRDGPGLRIRAGNQERIGRGDAWTTTFWKLPSDPNRRKGAIPLLDADTGKDVEGNIQFLGQAAVTLAGQQVNVNRYRLLTRVNTELWFDGSDRLVRQMWTEDGHKIDMEMIHLQRN